jgi:cytochrome c5
MQKLVTIAFGAILMLGGCGSSSGDSDSETEEGPAGPATGSTCPTGSKLTYESFGKPFFNEFCVSCHAKGVAAADRQGAPLDHNFDTLDGIVEEAEHIDEVAAAGPKATNTSMPPKGSKAPSEAQRKQLGEWIACGTP